MSSQIICELVVVSLMEIRQLSSVGSWGNRGSGIGAAVGVGIGAGVGSGFARGVGGGV